MLVGDVISATVPWVKENPVIAPQVLRLTSAVACCHVGFLAKFTGSPSSTISVALYLLLAGTWQGLQDGLDLRIARVIGVLEQHADVLRGRRRRTDHPFPVDVGHERGLSGRAGDRFGAQIGESGPRNHGRRTGGCG